MPDKLTMFYSEDQIQVDKNVNFASRLRIPRTPSREVAMQPTAILICTAIEKRTCRRQLKN